MECDDTGDIGRWGKIWREISLSRVPEPRARALDPRSRLGATRLPRRLARRRRPRLLASAGCFLRNLRRGDGLKRPVVHAIDITGVLKDEFLLHPPFTWLVAIPIPHVYLAHRALHDASTLH